MLAAAPNAGAVDPDHVSFTQEGCRNDGTITLPNGGGDFICDDAAYSTGNLGKGWNELDLVPFRITADAGGAAPASQTYTIAVAVDRSKNTTPGFDFLSVPVLNTDLSDASCSAPTVGAPLTTGTTTVTLYRYVTITQAANTTCVYDYYARLALGSHDYPGASLHANLLNDDSPPTSSGIGSHENSIPVNEISPQELDKDMTATQDSDHAWNVTKSPIPASLNFGNTCDPNGSLSQSVAIQVSWAKLAASPSGVITVVTHVYATNPAARTITTNVSDQIYSGNVAIGLPATSSTDVPANTTMLVLTHSTTVPAGTTGLNDIATGTYVDQVTSLPIPGTTTATASASVQSSGTVNNASATITDVESITGTGLTFSVDSTSGAGGNFNNGYVVGTPTTGPVSWTSNSQTSSGSVTFNKTVYATAATVISGSLDDTATLTGSEGFTTSATGSVGVTTNATTSLSVSKTTTLDIATAQVFTFHLIDDATDTPTGDTATVNMPALANGPVSSNTISGLSPTGTYYFHEDATAPYAAQDTSPVTFSLVAGNASTCSASISVANNAQNATARVKKDTLPASNGLWTFTLTGPGGLTETLNNVQAGAGYAAFANLLGTDGGTYTITETAQSGYDNTGITGDIGGNTARVTTNTTTRTCTFTLDLTSDSGQVFSCAFTNTAQGTIIVKKATNPTGASGTFTFTGNAAGSISDGGTITVNNLAPGTYTSTEADPTPAFDLTGISCDDGSSATPSTSNLGTRTATFKLDPGETITCTFTNRQRGTIIVQKVTDPAGAPGTFTFTGNAAGSISHNGTITVNNLVPGTYTSTEANPAPAFDLTGISCNDGSSATPSTGNVGTRTATFKLDAGETVTCTFTNRQRGHVRVVKTVNGNPLTGSQAWTFQLREGASAVSAGTTLETLVANAGNGGTINFTTNLVPGNTYQMCEQLMPGWMTSLGPPLFSVYNPSGDNSVVCTNFTVTAGQLKIIAIDNTPPPGGRALTIGFWKNWSSCSGGKQKATLDATLLAAANGGNPITLGLLVLNPNTLGKATACLYATRILDKSTITKGTKKSSDPLFNMAAQLLAADLNIQAGAGACAAATSAITAAHALLLKYNFDGDGYSPKLTSADANLANSLATTLDKYNNNKLC